ncbi:hypothetical protein HPP92_001696 [Vanilla planifolia]|uniref:CG-1 domain-containing protein n=1 Tax=Vanilla planifolia TaxID=51239 RepID=A0A835VI86_VANPL|nr:hypothetical protein HPP92_001696 [Vanilla planifolia]
MAEMPATSHAPLSVGLVVTMMEDKCMALRYFRKDGHCWRKKKDGKTVREAHEKLKSGSVDVLHCYYAHGEDNENFQRRSYWLLDGQLEHIVLVHYRDLNEGITPDVPKIQRSSATCSTPLSTSFVNQSSYASGPNNTVWKTQTTEFEDADSSDDFTCASRADKISGSGFHITPLPVNDMEDKVSLCTGSISHLYEGNIRNTSTSNRSDNPISSNQVGSLNFMLYGGQKDRGTFGTTDPFDKTQFNDNVAHSTWSEILSSNKNHTDIQEQSISFKQLNCTNVPQTRRSKPISDNYETIKFGLGDGYKVQPDSYSQPGMGAASIHVQVKEETAACSDHFVNDVSKFSNTIHTYEQPYQKHSYGGSSSDVNKPLECRIEVSDALKAALRRDSYYVIGELKKLDSFGRWMNKELGKDSNDSLMVSDCNYWNTIASQSDEKEVSSPPQHMQLDIGSLAPSLSQEQLFSIVDFSPDWAYSGTETKVLISGTFLGVIQPSNVKWCCMFGDVEVSAEILTVNAIRCQAPAHSPGRVPFYITCSNRLACSEIREFEYRENPPTVSFSRKNESEDEVLLQIRFVKFLSQGPVSKLECVGENCDKCNMKKLFHVLMDDYAEWDKIKEESGHGKYRMHLRDALLVKLFKGRLYEWLVYKVHEEGKGPNVLDKEGQGVIHLAAALGYEWAMKPIVASGVSPSFRDARGRTALHWAAYYGREETVVILMKLGAAPGAVEDPTSKFPEGQTAADLASSRGHKGIAGYLAEADLTSHLFSMTLSEKAGDSSSTALVSENSSANVEGQDLAFLDEGQTPLRESLAAVRNSAQAAARIQAAFRVQSFRQRELTKTIEKPETDEVIMFSSLNNSIHRRNHFNNTLHTAATKIQQKYRGWKGRREFLKIRDRIVKIQAHVRGHQARKQYKKVVWSVSIVEKLILRWRRKGSGLRGFCADKSTIGAEQDAEKNDEYEFLRLGRKQKVIGVEKALARVKSMVRYPEARDQYMRLVKSSNKSMTLRMR